MAGKRKLEGCMVALVTPFRNGKIDEPALKGLLDFHLRAKTDVIIPCGTTGESATMSHEEHRYLMTFVIDYVNGRVPVVCGAGSNNTEEALGLVRHARQAGADGVLVVTPYYNKPTQEGLYRHYEKIAGHAEIPVILYNVPGRTGVSLAPATVARLAGIENVAAIKEASGSLAQVDRIQALCDLPVLSGEDSLTFPMMALGARGVISVTANIVPAQMRRMVHAALKGDMKTGRTLHRRLSGLFDSMFMETNPIPVKTALAMMKKIRPEFRLPLCPMSREASAVLRRSLKQAGVLK